MRVVAQSWSHHGEISKLFNCDEAMPLLCSAQSCLHPVHSRYDLAMICGDCAV